MLMAASHHFFVTNSSSWSIWTKTNILTNTHTHSRKNRISKLDRLKIKEKGKCVLNTISEAKENSILLIYLNIPMN